MFISELVVSESFVGLRPLHIIDNAIDANAVSQILDKYVLSFLLKLSKPL